LTVTLVADAFVEDGVELEACVEVCELELLPPHAATTRATPAAARAPLARNATFLEKPIFVTPALWIRDYQIARVVPKDTGGREILPAQLDDSASSGGG